MPTYIKAVVLFLKVIAVLGNKNIKFVGFAIYGFPKRSGNIQLESSLIADTGFDSYVRNSQQGRKCIYFYIGLTVNNLLKKKKQYEVAATFFHFYGKKGN